MQVQNAYLIGKLFRFFHFYKSHLKLRGSEFPLVRVKISRKIHTMKTLFQKVALKILKIFHLKFRTKISRKIGEFFIGYTLLMHR